MSHRETGEKPEVVYGIHAVREALRNRAVDYVLVAQGQHNPRVQEIIDACRASGIGLRFAPRPAVERAAGNTQHQNVVAVCTPRGYDDLQTLLAHSARPLLVVLDGVEDPANLGAIVRTAVAGGCDGIVIPERRVARTSASQPAGPDRNTEKTSRPEWDTRSVFGFIRFPKNRDDFRLSFSGLRFTIQSGKKRSSS
jgi:tRNA G18 (ribose-2'-O)-methylase SpoU